MSTAHIYGDPLTKTMTEQEHYGLGLAPTVGRAWEQACKETTWLEDRVVYMRTGFVLAAEGGPLPLLTRLARFGLGGTVAKGNQGMSWIHIADLCAFCLRAIDNTAYEGTYNVCAPKPIPQKELMRAIRVRLGQILALPAPSYAVRVASRLLNTDPKLILLGRYVISKKLKPAHFAFDTIKKAMAELQPTWFYGFKTKCEWLDKPTES